MLLFPSGCSDSGNPDKAPDNSPNKQISVFVTIPPLKNIIGSIAGKYAEISILVPVGNEPHDYQPTPKQILMLAGAEIFFETGMPFEIKLIKKLGCFGNKSGD